MNMVPEEMHFVGAGLKTPAEQTYAELQMKHHTFMMWNGRIVAQRARFR